MRRTKWILASCLTLPLLLAGCEGDDGTNGVDGADGIEGAAGADGTAGQDAVASTVALSFLGRYETGEFDESAAEIVDYDPATRQVFVVNANSGRVDILDISAPSLPTLVSSLDLASDIVGAIDALTDPAQLGAANSVAVSGTTLAVAVEADTKQDNGYVAFYQTDGTFLSAVEAGALPDMVIFTPDGNTVLVANEGEPNGDYSVDPEGSITLVDISAGAGSVTAANVTHLRFTDFNSGGSKTLGSDVRISSKSASVAQDLEPEYIAVSADSSTAWVALQENSSLAVIDIAAKQITSVLGLGYKLHSVPGNELDASNRDGGVNIRQWPLRGVYMPDTIDSYEFNGITYLVTANEGDGREYLTDATDATDCTAQGGFDFDDGDCFHYLDEIRVKDIEDTGATIELDNLSRFAIDVATLTADENLGRIKVISTLGAIGCPADSLETTGQPTTGCAYEALYSFGARSFSIWNGSTGELVFDSGSDFETITAQRLGNDFNATNDENGGDDRSDDKGPEPEAIEIARIAGKTYAFIGLERVGGIMVYNISNPEKAEFVQYINTRDFSVDVETLVDAGDFSAVGDLGPESIRFIAAEDSPNGEALLVVGNEVSGTTALFGVNIIDND
ncbi:MerR family transcriptional regulator [Kineobactrum sediminis]|uniref:MerR family transcriptional regulator n=1 Tax=Kineobactrum sediminis TaxID=1905677 RepID=A0A2N5XZV0_9GAMM|nr:choice-of-anchor I family protein [Kineobactrum sediminis]PLW81671.1 MerR family transcriptional regulator [Kineobactrum sediminis]